MSIGKRFKAPWCTGVVLKGEWGGGWIKITDELNEGHRRVGTRWLIS